MYIVTILVWHSRGEIRMQNGILYTAALTLPAATFCFEEMIFYLTNNVIGLLNSLRLESVVETVHAVNADLYV